MKYSFTLLMVILFLFSCELSKKDPSKIDNDEDGNENIHYSNEKDNQQENSEDTYKNYNDTITATRINNIQGVKHNAHIPTTKKASKSIKIQVVTIKKSQKAGKTKCTKSYIYMHKMPQKAATFGTNICIIYQRCK